MQRGLSYEARARAALSNEGFRFSSKLGQNFILDDATLDAVAQASGAGEGDAVLEIGPGAGSLTAALRRRGANVLAVEVDETLRPVLQTLLGDDAGVRLKFADIRRCDLAALRSELDELRSGGCARVAANLPYYITTDVLTMFCESDVQFDSLTIMLQREAAERVCAWPGDKQYCLTAALVNWKYEAQRVMELPRGLFTPAPHVDSTLLRLTPRPQPPAEARDAAMLRRVMKAAFLMRRKTMLNNLCAAFGLGRARAAAALSAAGLPQDVRGEALSQRQLASLSDAVGEATRGQG